MATIVQGIYKLEKSIRCVDRRWATAERVMQSTYTFTGEPLTVNVVQRTVETRVANLLATIVGEVRTSAIDGCSANILIRADTPNSFATCDVSISADDSLVERDAVAQAGACCTCRCRVEHCAQLKLSEHTLIFLCTSWHAHVVVT